MDDTTDSEFLPPEELQALLPGFRIDPEPLGTTAMSRVYRAADARLHDRKVAVKVMAGSLAAFPGFRKRFLREIELMAGLDHPHIMFVVAAAGPDDRLLYLVMPQAEGDLRARLAMGAMEPAAAARVIAQVASALDYAHDRGVAHRDVKPANILFGAGDHVYLSDFGVAKHAVGEDLTRVGDSIGTRRYTAPEVYSAAKRAAGSDSGVDRSGDVYSLGAVLFHCLTGQRPFDRTDDAIVARVQEEGPAPSVAEIRPDLPAEFDAIAAKAMSRDRADRYRTCGELARAFEQAVARAEDGPAKPGRVRRPGRLALAGALAAGLALGGGLSFLAFGPELRDSTGDGVVAGAVDPTAAPVTGDDQVERAPRAGECLTADEDRYVVVACDSEAAAKRVYRVVTDPEDPNPAQPDHDDAAWEACGHEGVEFDYYWADSAVREGREWEPETDRIYYFLCYQRL
ncbi:serine/threonine-protein kinase [Glycomyces sp. MUSA5-2]|uniref:serine/threonine-protein kinase n=1 Tax=Glycomyces sp. MUSA5-2 TaxID=2053002 RepID=UPI0030092D25